MDTYKRKAGDQVQAEQLMQEQEVDTVYGPQTAAAGEWKVDEGGGRVVVYTDPAFEAAFEPVTPQESATPPTERTPRRPPPSPPPPPSSSLPPLEDERDDPHRRRR